MKYLSKQSWIFLGLSTLGLLTLILRWSIQGNIGTYFSSIDQLREIKSTGTFAFLLWNLFLAWIPYILALLFQRWIAKGKSLWLTGPLFFAWLVFLPNAPYIITDFLHLRWRHPIPHWFDLMTLFIFAYVGLKLGLSAVRLIHRSVAAVYSKKLAWLISICSLMLCGHGVYLGRVLRYNTWDLLYQPMEILRDFLHGAIYPLQNPGASMAWIMGVFLVLIYLLNEFQDSKSKIDTMTLQ